MYPGPVLCVGLDEGNDDGGEGDDTGEGGDAH